MSDHSEPIGHKQRLHSGPSQDEELNRTQTLGSLSITPEMFAQMYQAPKTQVSGSLRSTFGNPAPIALGGFILCTTPLSMALLGWQGAGGFAGAANVGSYFFFGGLLLLLGGVGEWLLGNTFPATVFTLYGAFWFTTGATISPNYGAYATYSTTDNPADGLTQPEFFATFAFFLVAMTMLSFVFAIASTRTNAIFFCILTLLVPTFGCLAASFFALSKGHPGLSTTLQHAGAALLFAVSMFGWYIFLALVLLAVDFPVVVPLGDLSSMVPGKGLFRRKSKKRPAKNEV